ncbi:hypothetical protein ACQP1O_42945 (plasmid) [Nocardia sp. CA-151230]|uniref:hypothetical protein n=1 Tax=Nocardia sp. CA-151230 TaxID=3239982 RepID=UPI003D923272
MPDRDLIAEDHQELDITGWRRLAGKWRDKAQDRLSELYVMHAVLEHSLARIAELEAERPRFSQRQFVQAFRDRDEAQSRAAELAERVPELEQRLDRVTDLFEAWAAEENEHRTAGYFGIAEGLHVAIEQLREAVHG